MKQQVLCPEITSQAQMESSLPDPQACPCRDPAAPRPSTVVRTPHARPAPVSPQNRTDGFQTPLLLFFFFSLSFAKVPAPTPPSASPRKARSPLGAMLRDVPSDGCCHLSGPSDFTSCDTPKLLCRPGPLHTWPTGVPCSQFPLAPVDRVCLSVLSLCSDRWTEAAAEVAGQLIAGRPRRWSACPQ